MQMGKDVRILLIVKVTSKSVMEFHNPKANNSNKL